MLGLREPLQLAPFKPAQGLNPAIQARYEANRSAPHRNQICHSPTITWPQISRLKPSSENSRV
jgi:hypothetical protein